MKGKDNAQKKLQTGDTCAFPLGTSGNSDQFGSSITQRPTYK